MIRAFSEWFAAGGAVMPALAGVGIVLFFLIADVYLTTGAEVRRVLAEPRPTDEEFHLLRVSGLRRMGIIHACVIVAPLLGLLGTVVGVKATFDGMLAGATVAGVGHGIGEALLTTQYGLCIAVPGLLAERLLRRRIDRIETVARSAPDTNGGGEACAEAS